MPRYRMTAPTQRYTPRLGTVDPDQVVEATPEFDEDTGIQTFPNPNFFTEETDADKANAARQDTAATTAPAKKTKTTAPEAPEPETASPTSPTPEEANS